MENLKISVCVATYNGEKYIQEQLKSILPQLKKYDEVIVSDDGSKDNTIFKIKELKDNRIKIIENKSLKGVVRNFENALKNAKGDIVFLSDQDDLWLDNKVEKIMACFLDNKITCVLSNATIIDSLGNSKKKTFFKNPPIFNMFQIIIKNRFIGCTMAFRNNNRVKVLPFPKRIPMHDWFIGLKHIQKGNIFYIKEPLILYRRHENNITSENRTNMFNVLKWRIEIIKSLFFD